MRSWILLFALILLIACADTSRPVETITTPTVPTVALESPTAVTTLTATLRQQHTIIPIEGADHAWSLAWSDDGQSLTYATSDAQWPPHVRSQAAYQNWWLYDSATQTQEALPPPQTRVTNAVRETLNICPFPLPEVHLYPYPCSPILKESPTSNFIVFPSISMGHEANSWLATIDGTNVTHLETIPEAPDNVIWSSDDQWILIGVYAGIDHSNVYYLVSSDGAFVENLGDLTETTHWRVQGVRPQFSPDGQKIAFVGMETNGRRLSAEQQDDESAYKLYVLDLTSMSYDAVSTRFGTFQWSHDSQGLYVLDGTANTVGNAVSHMLDGLRYASFYYLDLMSPAYPEQKLASEIPVYLPYTGTWSYSPQLQAMAGIFDVEEGESVLGILFLSKN